MSLDLARLKQNLADVQQRIAAACGRAGRTPGDVKLIAVTKYADIDAVRGLVELGVTRLGESRPQQLIERQELLAGPLEWHLIGHLQRNKARRVLAAGAVIHSVDSLRLLQFLDELAGELRVTPPLLLEVNVTGEASKQGFAPEDLLGGWQQVCDCRHARVEGLMTMAQLSDDPEAARPAFAALRKLRDRLRTLSPAGPGLPELSMGMTGDFEIAIEEGATCVRIGSALFESL